jgi:hypothetical protein
VGTGLQEPSESERRNLYFLLWPKEPLEDAVKVEFYKDTHIWPVHRLESGGRDICVEDRWPEKSWCQARVWAVTRPL